MQHQADNPTAYRWVVIGSLPSLGATQLTIVFVLGLLLPDISDDLDLSPSEQGWRRAEKEALIQGDYDSLVDLSKSMPQRNRHL